MDAATGEEVESEDIIKGYQVSKGQYIEITDEDLEAVAVDSTRTIDIDQFVPREEIDDLYNRAYCCGNGLGAGRFAAAAQFSILLTRIPTPTRERR